ncbi:hypothetical protein SeMB42_g05079 [Synchytrium endobioticum]|uniref:Uncharacterized protein n=1 Tax=Synchytrium endobioticum TaxID=286115 RepID=A0A507CTQ0_9FUNG|nr:hypothetical protein SeMB42_g05079 [Synchytrium endobioticum]
MRALFIIAIFLYCSSCALAGDPPEPQPSQLFKLFGPLWPSEDLPDDDVPYNYLAHHEGTAPNLANPNELREMELWLRLKYSKMVDKWNELLAERLAHPRRIHYKRAKELDSMTQTDRYLGLPFEDMPSIEQIPLDFTLEEYRRMCEAFRDFGDTIGRIRIDLGKYKCEYLNMRSARTSDETVKNELKAERRLLRYGIAELEQRLNDRERQFNGCLNYMHPPNYGGDLGQTPGHGNTADGDVPHTSPGRDEGPSY